MKEKMIAALKRAAWTMAQTAVATIGTAALLEDVNWIMVISASVLAGVVSLLKSVTIGMPEVAKEDDFFTGEDRFDDESEADDDERN